MTTITTPWIFAVCTIIGLFNYIDRGIIPGSTNEFNSFIVRTTGTSQPDVCLGLLQSSFVVGFLIGGIIFSNFIHRYERFTLTFIGCTIWMFAVLFSGVAHYTESYIFLLFCRIFSGFGEASLQCTIPPWIQHHAGNDKKGIWLAIFYTTVPVGGALGYAYSSMVSESYGWQYAFFGEALMAFPFIVCLFLIGHYAPDRSNILTSDSGHIQLTHVGIESSHNKETGKEMFEDPMYSHPAKHPSLISEFKEVIKRPIYVCFIFGLAAEMATMIGLSTFGSAFVMGLGYFDYESQASTIFGILVSLAGVCGTPLGGLLIDGIVQYKKKPLALQENRGGNDEDGHEDAVTENQPEPVDEQTLLEVIGSLTYWANFLATLIFCLLYYVEDRFSFMALITFGCFLVFTTYTGINMATMLSVPLKHQSFALALGSTVGHLFGDVPSPILTGWLKDSLAPGCVASQENEQNVAASDSCRADGEGLRMTMFIVSVWMYWCVVLFGIAWHLIKTTR